MVFVDCRLIECKGENGQLFRKKFLANTEGHLGVVVKKSIKALLQKDDHMARHLPVNGLVVRISCQPWAHILGGLWPGWRATLCIIAVNVCQTIPIHPQDMRKGWQHIHRHLYFASHPTPTCRWLGGLQVLQNLDP